MRIEKPYQLSFLSFAFLLLCSIGFSQNAKQDFAKVTLAYLNAKEISLKMVTYGYESGAQKKPVLVAEGIFLRSGEKYYSKFKDSEMIKVDGKVVIVNHQNKTIQFFEEAKDKKVESFSIPMDSLMSGYDSVVYKGNVGGDKCYVIYDQSAQYPVMEIFIDSKSNFVSRMVLHLPKKQKKVDYGMDRLEVKYSKPKMQPVNYYDISRFLKKTESGYVKTQKYLDYNLIM